mmetsp:Transcript_9302/g.23299  ORF Transcript_9302/g.23299 Transcript_9302/m.23299 type:complete len:210 (+) Transcript_9302:312-941(+)
MPCIPLWCLLNILLVALHAELPRNFNAALPNVAFLITGLPRGFLRTPCASTPAFIRMSSWASQAPEKLSTQTLLFSFDFHRPRKTISTKSSVHLGRRWRRCIIPPAWSLIPAIRLWMAKGIRCARGGKETSKESHGSWADPKSYSTATSMNRSPPRWITSAPTISSSIILHACDSTSLSAVHFPASANSILLHPQTTPSGTPRRGQTTS